MRVFGETEVQQCQGCAVDHDGNILVADFVHKRIAAFSPDDGSLLADKVISTAPLMPFSVIVDTRGRVIVGMGGYVPK